MPSDDVYVTSAPPGFSGRRSASMPEFWTCEGVRLREFVAELHEIPESRVELVAPIDDDARYDFVLLPPRLESPDTMNALMRDGVAKHFGLRFDRELRATDVFVMTAPHGVSGVSEPACGGLGSISMDIEVPEGIEQLSADEQRSFFEQHLRRRMKGFAGPPPRETVSRGFVGASGTGTSEDLCRMLEGMLDRLVVDETGVGGTFEFNISAENGVEGFLDALQQQLGIVVTPVRRDVEVLVVRPRN